MKSHPSLNLAKWTSVFFVFLVSVLKLSGQGNLVFNGDFEAGSAGWTLVRGATVGGATGHHGLACFLVSSNSSPANEPTASQLITGLVAGATYMVSGEYQPGKDRGGASSTNASFGVALDGTYLLQIAAPPGGDWQSFSFSYTTVSPSHLLSLSSQINGTGVEYAIDNISMQLIPEPSSLALVGLGGFLCAAYLFHRRC